MKDKLFQLAYKCYQNTHTELQGAYIQAEGQRCISSFVLLLSERAAPSVYCCCSCRVTNAQDMYTE